MPRLKSKIAEIKFKKIGTLRAFFVDFSLASLAFKPNWTNNSRILVNKFINSAEPWIFAATFAKALITAFDACLEKFIHIKTCLLIIP